MQIYSLFTQTYCSWWETKKPSKPHNSKLFNFHKQGWKPEWQSQNNCTGAWRSGCNCEGQPNEWESPNHLARATKDTLKNIINGGIYCQWNKPDADNILNQIQQATSSKKPLLIFDFICFNRRIKIINLKMWQTSGEAPLPKVN